MFLNVTIAYASPDLQSLGYYISYKVEILFQNKTRNPTTEVHMFVT